MVVILVVMLVDIKSTFKDSLLQEVIEVSVSKTNSRNGTVSASAKGTSEPLQKRVQLSPELLQSPFGDAPGHACHNHLDRWSVPSIHIG
jgi:hypothetical protein